MPNTNCLSGPAFSIVGNAYFSGTTASFQVTFDNPEDESSVLAYEWHIDDTLLINHNNAQFAGQLNCGDHTVGVRILSTDGWSGIQRLEFATCRTATEMLFYGVDTVNEGSSATYYILQLYSDGTSKDITSEFTFTSTPGGSFNGNIFTADTDLSGYENYEVTITASSEVILLYKPVTVINTTPIVQVSLEIVGPASLNEGGNAFYTVVSTYSDGSQEDLTSSYVFSSSEGNFLGNRLFIPSNAILNDNRTATIYASQSGIAVLSKQIAITDVSVGAGVLVVDLYSDRSSNIIGFIANAEVAGSRVAAYTGHNIVPAGATPSAALILASGFNSPTWRFEFNIEKLVLDYPQTQNFVFYIKGRSGIERSIGGAFSVKTSDAVMILPTTPEGVLMPSTSGGSNHYPLTSVNTMIFSGANGSYDEDDLNTILKFTYNVPGDRISYTTYEEPIEIADFDYMAVRFHWISGSGSDLDVLVGFENNGTLSDQLYVGYGQQRTIPINTSPESDAYLWWGLDNTGQQGYEGILIGIRKFIDAYPNSPNIVEIGLYAVWFGVPATGDFSVELVTYKGGEMYLEGNNFQNVGGVQVSSNTVNLKTLLRRTGASSSTYFKVGTVKYNKTTQTATIQIN